MNPSNHTSGPWLVDFESDEFDSKQSKLRIIDGSEASLNHPQGRLTIANLNVCAFAPHMDEPMANARLIASAPDLLRALEWLVDDWERVTGRTLPDDHEAKAAISKAKGQE